MLDGEQRETVQTIRTSGLALLTIINDLLDFSKIEAGKVELKKSRSPSTGWSKRRSISSLPRRARRA